MGLECREINSRLREWYRLPLGRALAQAEKAALAQVLPTLFGYYLLQIGATDDDWLADSRILHHVVMSHGLDDQPAPGILQGLPSALPVRSDSIDSLLLLHTLEFSEDPHQVLREADRVLVPEGHIIILGFNPYSFWGLRRLLARKRAQMPWSGRFIGAGRLRDWLNLLGFEMVHQQKLFYRPPVASERISNRLAFMESGCERWCRLIGGVYMYVARKKISTLTPIKPRWRPKRSVVTAGLADGSTRNLHE
jgi:SAM-dependent methyltransferase